jgi:hypothetical protein
VATDSCSGEEISKALTVIVTLRPGDAVFDESVATNAGKKVPATVGTPDSTPLVVSSERPGGMIPAVKDQR